jgi:hypothetical protein
MPRRHIRTYRRQKPLNEAEVGGFLSAEDAPVDHRRTQAQPTIDYRPIVAVLGLVIFGLAAIAFILTLRMK